jgi:hypothetical protein
MLVSEYIRFSPVSMILKFLHTYFDPHVAVSRRRNGWRLKTLKQYFFISVNVVLFLFNNVIYVFLLYDCMFMYDYPDWGFSRALSSVVRQMPGWYPQRRGTARTLPNFFVALCIFLYCSMYFLCCSMYSLFCDVPCIVCVYMCTDQLPPGGYPIAFKYKIYHIYQRNTMVFFIPLRLR